MILLSVNLNKICLLRNSRQTESPKIEEFGRICLEHGARGLTLHPRPDCRHAMEKDVEMAAKLCQEYKAELNIEGNPLAKSNRHYSGLVQMCESFAPAQCTMVPDDDHQSTSDHGWPLASQVQIKECKDVIQAHIDALTGLNIRTALFVEPDADCANAVELGVDAVELYTQKWANAVSQKLPNARDEFSKMNQAGLLASKAGLRVNAGHDITLECLAQIKSLAWLAEVSIGHELTIDALRVGFTKAVSRYIHVLES